MTFFESLLVLLLLAVALLQLARRLSLPYPTMLAGAGVLVAMIPGTPEITIEPETWLALFVTPALVDAAYDFPPESARRFRVPLVTYAVLAVLLTTIVVAWISKIWLGLPLAAGVALGAMVAPPDAAAATAILRKFNLPRRIDSILKGESLFNDATALLLFGGALIVLSSGGLSVPVALRLGFAVPGGIALGIAAAYIIRSVNRMVKDTLGGNLLQFVFSYLLWIAAVHLRLSPVLCVIAFAMTIARKTDPADFDARMRVQSFAVWSAVVFTLNVFAFLLMGMQAKSIVSRMHGQQLRDAMIFAALVNVAVVCVRLVVVLCFSRAEVWWQARRGQRSSATFGGALFVGWCGMRGFITLTTALALPASFPHRDTVVLAAFSVVLTTLVLQGSTLAPLAHLLQLDRTEEATKEIVSAEVALARSGLTSIAEHQGPEADNLRYRLQLRLQRCTQRRAVPPLDRLRDLGLTAVRAERETLEDLRSEDKVGPVDYLSLQEQLDWVELTMLRDPDRQIEEI